MSNVFSIEGKPVEGATPNRETVEFLESLVERAKTGDIKAVAIAMITEADGAVTCYVSSNRKFSLIGAVSWLHQRLLNDS